MSQLNGLASKCAQYYAGRGKNDHSCPYKGKTGENLARFSNKLGKDDAATTSTKNWYNEVKLYRYNNPGPAKKTGHFTQVVWKDSRKLGFGVAYGKKGDTYTVALYDPQGNFRGKFPQNVKPANKRGKREYEGEEEEPEGAYDGADEETETDADDDGAPEKDELQYE